jgi:flavin-dependent dehydrogenase
MLARLDAVVARSFPALVDDEAGRYAHTIPSPTTDPASLREVAGDRWALLGDAAALADPITGEGIQYALRSAHLLAATLRSGSRPRAELLRAAALKDRFQAPGFSRRMVHFAERSGAIRRVLADLVLGEQGYRGLKRRLVRAAPRFAVEYAATAAARRLGI